MTPFSSGLTQFTAGAGTITLSNLPQLSFQGQNPFTLELWVYLDALVDQMTLISCANEFVLRTQGSGLWVARAGQGQPLTSTNVLQAHTWFHLAITFNGVNMTLFVNGLPVTQISISDQGAPSTGSPLQLGGNFYGQVDSCRVWNRVVSATDIARSMWTDYPALTPGLLAQLDFTSAPPVDSSGNAVTVTLSPSGVAYYPFAPATYFEGNAFADPYNDTIVNPAGTANDFTVLAWVNPELLGTLQYIFTNGPDESTYGMTLALNPAGNVCFQVGSSPILTSPTALQPGTWSYLAVTWTASTSTGVLYLNGAVVASLSTMTLGTGSQPVGSPLLGAIASVNLALPISTFQGYIQNVSVWTAALTAQDVQNYQAQDPQNDPRCVADYNLTTFPAQNVSTFNPVGLVAGAQLATWQPAGIPAPGALAAAPTIYNHDNFEVLLASLAMDELPRAHLLNLATHNQQLAEADLAANRYAGVQDIQIQTLPNGNSRLVVRENGRMATVYEGALDPCTLWFISLITSVVLALITAFGVPARFTDLFNRFSTFLSARFASTGIAARLAEIIGTGPPSVSSAFIRNLAIAVWENSMLMPLLKITWGAVTNSMNVWAIVSITANFVIMLSPAAGLKTVWFLAQLAYSIYSVQQVILQRPANCPS
ncbi:LamG domain-containing protein [Hymenobacter saemangeumensis]|uniref:LamG domain-containing protein n=1 Tax=Hymenobacter saemangeumensis TaxID=1084522 RepID=UPI0031E8258A